MATINGSNEDVDLSKLSSEELNALRIKLTTHLYICMDKIANHPVVNIDRSSLKEEVAQTSRLIIGIEEIVTRQLVSLEERFLKALNAKTR